MAHDAPPSPELDDRTIETAIALDIDPFAEDHLLWIARSAQNDAELPLVGIDARSRISPRATRTPRSAWSDPITRGPRSSARSSRRSAGARRRARIARTRNRPASERERASRAASAAAARCENARATSRMGKKLHVDARIAAMEASHRIALKGAQRKVAELERRAIEREEAWENERMEAEARASRVVVEAEERSRAGLEDERRAMRDTIRRAVGAGA